MVKMVLWKIGITRSDPLSVDLGVIKVVVIKPFPMVLAYLSIDNNHIMGIGHLVRKNEMTHTYSCCFYKGPANNKIPS
jgi:hypothetical protein